MSAKFSTFGAVYSMVRHISELKNKKYFYGLSTDEREELIDLQEKLKFYSVDVVVKAQFCLDAKCERDKYYNGEWVKLSKHAKKQPLYMRAIAQFNVIPF